MYDDFAALYDRFMEDTPYDEWCNNILQIMHSEGINDGIVCELGCGTGEMTGRLRDAGYDMIGIDNSVSMLNVAKNKELSEDSEETPILKEAGAASDSSDILYICQDMREFELYGTVRAIVSVYDSMNYIMDPDDLATVFRLVDNYLDPNGLFIFDFNTDYKYEKIIGDMTVAEVRDDASFIWENDYDTNSKINQYDITFFEEVENGLYRKFTETHLQRGYSLSEIKALLKAAGLRFVDAMDVDTKKKPTAKSQRILVTARESGRKNNE